MDFSAAWFKKKIKGIHWEMMQSHILIVQIYNCICHIPFETENNQQHLPTLKLYISIWTNHYNLYITYISSAARLSTITHILCIEN